MYPYVVFPCFSMLFLVMAWPVLQACFIQLHTSSHRNRHSAHHDYDLSWYVWDQFVSCAHGKGMKGQNWNAVEVSQEWGSQHELAWNWFWESLGCKHVFLTNASSINLVLWCTLSAHPVASHGRRNLSAELPVHADYLRTTHSWLSQRAFGPRNVTRLLKSENFKPQVAFAWVRFVEICSFRNWV